MSDIATIFDNTAMSGDYALDGSLLAVDDTLKTAILHSIFSDSRASETDELGVGESPRGWWGDHLAETAGDRYGSRFWTLRREKLTAEVASRARDILREALQWMVDDGLVASVTVEVETAKPASLYCLITVETLDGDTEAYDLTTAWSA